MNMYMYTVYSCFERACQKKKDKSDVTILKLIWGNLGILWSVKFNEWIQ